MANKQEDNIIQRSGYDFFMNEYFDYAKYTIANRALPSIIDGLKPGARKIMHASFKVLHGGKEKKFFDVVGGTYSHSQYHHGDSSLVSTIMTLASQHTDNLAPLEIIGTGGDLRNAEAAAPRYLEVKLSQWASLLQKDHHILDYNFDTDMQVEPKHYLPILPLVLTARSTGMAVGYKYNAQVSYNPADLVEQCIHVLKTGKLTKRLNPHIEGFSGIFKQVGTQVKAFGRYQLNKDHVIVTELPPNQTFSKFENNLSALLELGKITNWENLSKDDIIKYRIDVNPTELAKLVKKNMHNSVFNLAENLTRPTYTLLDEHGKIIIFSTAEEVLKYFVEYRLKMYDKLKSINQADLKTRIGNISDILKFLDLYFAGTIRVGKDIKLSDTEKQLKSYSLPKSVLDVKMSRLTKEEYTKLEKSKLALEVELKYITETPAQKLYLKDLEAILPKMHKAFPQQEFEIIKIEE